MTKEEFIEYCKKLGINLSIKNINDLEEYKNLLIEWNKKFNLTTIIEEKDIYLKHFYDSLCLVKATNLDNKIICDFGTGAGFPGMVIAIIFNNSKITLIESNNKKVSFLEEVKNKLNLNNVEILNKRVEDYGKNNREIFDIVTCRAVSNLNIILELSSSLLKINGEFIPLKSNVLEELSLVNNLENLSYKLENKIDYELPIENSKRTLLIFKKFKITELTFMSNNISYKIYFVKNFSSQNSTKYEIVIENKYNQKNKL